MAIEARVAEPMLPLGLFRDRSFTGAQIAAFAISASFFAIFLYTTLYLQQILGLSAIEAGLTYLPGTITMLFVSAATSTLGTKVSARLMVAGGLALVAVGMVLFCLAGVDSSWTVILPGAMVALIGTGLFNPALTAVALGTVSPDQSGVAAGVNDTFRQAGIAVGVAALGALVPGAGRVRRRLAAGVRRRAARRAAGRRGRSPPSARSRPGSSSPPASAPRRRCRTAETQAEPDEPCSLPPDPSGANPPAAASPDGGRRCCASERRYGRRPRQRSDVSSDPPSRSRPAAAKPALISRFSSRVPICEPRRS